MVESFHRPGEAGRIGKKAPQPREVHLVVGTGKLRSLTRPAALTSTEEAIIPRNAKTVEGGRALLNLPGHHSTAAICAEVVSTRTGSYTYASVQLSDCSRTINLEFDVNDANEYENNLHKVDTMIKTLQKFRRAVAKAQR